MSLALYRKYRPRTFAEIIGQEHVTEPLSQALRSNRLHHAYLFSGPRGCGKTSSARILARSLNCEQGPTPEPCGECESCKALAPDGAGSIDVIEIDAASHGGVDDARDLRERAFFAPVSSRYKIYVIDEAHMVSSAGFNALLKLVEEPPDYVKFVFATTEPEKVLGTIKSRTHHYPFRLIPPGTLRPYLERLCVAEGVSVQPAVFPLVVRAGGGSARDSLSVLDQLIAGAGAEGVTYARAVALLGVTDAALIDEICDALAAGDGASAFATIDRVAEAGHDARRFAGDLLERLRDLIVLQQVPDAVEKGLLDGAADELARMALQAQRFGPATLSRMADIVHTGLIDMRGTTAPRLVLELITARMLLPGADDSTASLLQRMERMERRLTLTGDDAPRTNPSGVPATPPTAPSVTAAPVEAAPVARSAPTEPRPVPVPETRPERPASGTVDAVVVRGVWEEVVTMVRRKNQRTAAVVREGIVRDVDGDTIVLLFKHAFHAQQTMTTAQELLLDALHEVLGGRWQLRCEVAGQDSVARTAASPVARDSVRSVASPARPGPGGEARPTASDRGPAREQSARGATPVEEDWPTPATLGGTDGSAESSTVEEAPHEPAAPQQPTRRSTTESAAPTGSGRTAARAAAAGKAKPPLRGKSTGRDDAWVGGGEEPPYDPEIDGPIRSTSGHVGFDPGDEPIDDGDDGQVRQSSEQQALDLLRQTLGAEKIG